MDLDYSCNYTIILINFIVQFPEIGFANKLMFPPVLSADNTTGTLPIAFTSVLWKRIKLVFHVATISVVLKFVPPSLIDTNHFAALPEEIGMLSI
jgi:hypothetical protein